MSTCALCRKFLRFADENIPVNLSISLHAPNDDIRKEIMRCKKESIDKILSARSIIYSEDRKKITLIHADPRVNDRRHARRTREKLAGLLCHVNLIPVNTVTGHRFIKSGRERIESFKGILEIYGIPVTCAGSWEATYRLHADN